MLKSKNNELRRLAALQRRAQAYGAQGVQRGNHNRVRRAMRLLTLANERGQSLARSES